MDGSRLEPKAFSRGELDRVIRRAVELQFEAGSEDDDSTRLDESEVRRIGGEVGIDDRFLRRAIGELRAEQLLPESPAPPGRLSRFLGSRLVRVHRVVPGSVGEIQTELGEHFEVAETLSPVRDRKGTSLWEPSRGALAGIRRGLRWRGYRYELARISSLQVSLEPLEEGFALVNLVADLRRERAGTVFGAAAGFGLVGGAAGLGLGILSGFPLLALPVGILGILGGVRLAGRLLEGRTERVRTTMEGILDRLEGGRPLARRSLPPTWRERLRGE